MEAQAEAVVSSLLPETRRRWEAVRVAATVPFFCATILMLWESGYPRWRVGIAAAVLVGFTVLLPRVSWILSTPHSASTRGEEPWSELLSAGFILALLSATGGLRSPFLIGLAAGIVTRYGALGWTPFVRGVAMLELAGLTALMFAPDWLVGPTVPGHFFNFMAGGTVVASVVTSFSVITVQKRAREESEAALARAREQMFAQLSQRTRDMEKVGASLSHELKNPLQAVKILVQLSSREAQEPQARDRLHVVEVEVDRMQALIKDYLSFSRPFDKLTPHPVSLASVCDDVVAVLRDRANACGISVERRGDARVEADARRLQEALHNLVSNAIDATPRGGSIQIGIAAEDGYARICVRDSGKGMSQETLAKVGTPFFTTREDGTGLGVALARAAFLQHGGSLEFRSEPGAGTTATAILPAKPMRNRLDGANRE